MSFIRDFYILKIPDIKTTTLPETKWARALPAKNNYTLHDVAEAYAMIEGKSIEKVYANIKKQFQKIDYIQKYKQEGEYSFPDLYLPIMTYHYFRRKDHRANSEDKTLHSEQSYLLRLYYPLLKAKAEGHEEIIEAYQKYRLFVIDEFIAILRSNDDGYLRTFINEILIKSVCRLSLRVLNAPLEKIEMI